MKIENEVNRILYNICCVKKTRSVDLLLKDVMAALAEEGNDFSEKEVVVALENIPLAKLSYSTYTDQPATISLISYQWSPD